VFALVFDVDGSLAEGSIAAESVFDGSVLDGLAVVGSVVVGSVVDGSLGVFVVVGVDDPPHPAITRLSTSIADVIA